MGCIRFEYDTQAQAVFLRSFPELLANIVIIQRPRFQKNAEQSSLHLKCCLPSSIARLADLGGVQQTSTHFDHKPIMFQGDSHLAACPSTPPTETSQYFHLKAVTSMRRRPDQDISRRRALRTNFVLGSLVLLGGPFSSTGTAPVVVYFMALGLFWGESCHTTYCRTVPRTCVEHKSQIGPCEVGGVCTDAPFGRTSTRRP